MYIRTVYRYILDDHLCNRCQYLTTCWAPWISKFFRPHLIGFHGAPRRGASSDAQDAPWFLHWGHEYIAGWWLNNPSEQMSSSVGVTIPNIWKNRKCSKPPTSSFLVDQPVHIPGKKHIIPGQIEHNTYFLGISDQKILGKIASWWFYYGVKIPKDLDEPNI